MNEPLLLSVREAAERLGLGINSTYALVREGRLRSISVGNRKRLIPAHELEDFITRETTATPQGVSRLTAVSRR